MNISSELQQYLFKLLSKSTQLNDIIKQRVYDRVPENSDFPYISFGQSNIVQAEADCIDGEDHFIQLDIWSRSVGKVECKNILDEVKRLVKNTNHEIEQNAIVSIEVDQSQILDDPDGLTTHGVVVLRIMAEVL